MDFKPQKGKQVKPELVLIYGVDKIGKSSWAASFPKPLFDDIEDRSGHLDVARLRPKDWVEQLAFFEWFKKSDYETLVVDSCDWLEALIVSFVIARAGKKTLTEVGDYGEGYNQVMGQWRLFLVHMSEIRAAGKNIVLTAHSEVKTVNDPMTLPYDHYQLKFYHKAAKLVSEAVDCILFASTETFVVDDKKKTKRGLSDHKRWLFTERRPAYDAGNSFGLPEKFELLETGGYAHYQSMKTIQDPGSEKALKSQIEKLLPRLAEEDRAEAESQLQVADAPKLARLLTLIKQMLEESK